MSKKGRHKQDLVGLFDEFVETGDAENLLRYLISNSSLPSPRGNLELAAAFSELVEDHSREGEDKFWELAIRMTAVSADEAPVNAPEEFIPFSGAVGVGSIASLSPQFFEPALLTLRGLAHDPRWRMREAVAMGLQRLLARRGPDTLRELQRWVASGDWLEMRAVAAAVADPSALRQEETALSALQLHRHIMDQVLSSGEGKSEDFRILRKALGYTLSVVVAAAPQDGFEYMSALIDTQDPDVLWIVKQNLRKNRLVKKFPEAVEATNRLLE